jgi:hypothetical protein
MKKNSVILFMIISGFSAAPAQMSSIPRLEKRGQAVQLIVDGSPYLILGGELTNTAASSPEHMKTVWPRLVQMNLNTVLTAVAWAWVEPEEGKFDFAVVDSVLDGARRNGMRVVFLWFGSWKNGISSFIPPWVKADPNRFPRAKIQNGKSVEVLTPFSETNLYADKRAYAAFMRRLAAADSEHRTVIMIQLQNEVGLLGDSRDRCPAAEAAFKSPVPKTFLDYMKKNRGTLLPEFKSVWDSAGSKTDGTWEQVFGRNAAADEIFMAWHYARYMDGMAAEGKEAYPIPVFTNTWIVQPGDRGAGDYPSGGPEPLTLEAWRAGAPHIDLNAPDIYLPNFAEWCARFNRNGNPLFVPESRGGAAGAANAFYAVGMHAGIGYSAFGIDRVEKTAQPVPESVQNAPLARAYAVLRQLTPAVLAHQSSGTVAAVLLNAENPKKDLILGNYIVNVELRRNRRDPSLVAPSGYGIFMAEDGDTFLAAGSDIQVTFRPNTPGPSIAGIAGAESGRFENGRWIPVRQMSGDDILLRYDLGAAAEINQSGSGLRFFDDGPEIQRVSLYRYE